MKQQLFLFEVPEEKTGAQHESPPADILSGAVAEEVFSTSEETHDGTGIEQDPFAAIEQERREEIENKLLLPKKKRGRKSFKDMDEDAVLVELPPDDVLFQKQYYSTTTVAEWFGVTKSQLLKWVAEFDVLQPKKGARGDRSFRPEDVKNLQLIYHLVRRRKFTSEGARQYLRDNKKALSDNLQLVESLTKLRQFLTELKAITT